MLIPRGRPPSIAQLLTQSPDQLIASLLERCRQPIPCRGTVRGYQTPSCILIVIRALTPCLQGTRCVTGCSQKQTCHQSWPGWCSRKTGTRGSRWMIRRRNPLSLGVRAFDLVLVDLAREQGERLPRRASDLNGHGLLRAPGRRCERRGHRKTRGEVCADRRGGRGSPGAGRHG